MPSWIDLAPDVAASVRPNRLCFSSAGTNLWSSTNLCFWLSQWRSPANGMAFMSLFVHSRSYRGVVGNRQREEGIVLSRSPFVRKGRSSHHHCSLSHRRSPTSARWWLSPQSMVYQNIPQQADVDLREEMHILHQQLNRMQTYNAGARYSQVMRTGSHSPMKRRMLICIGDMLCRLLTSIMVVQTRWPYHDVQLHHSD